MSVTPNPPQMTEASGTGIVSYAITEEFLGMPDANAPQYIGTAAPPTAYLIKADAYGEMAGAIPAYPQRLK